MTAEAPTSPPRYVVGIDLGTTNCAVGYVDSEATSNDATGRGDRFRVETFLIPQWVDWGQVERRPMLPSFHYELPESEASAMVGRLPWRDDPSGQDNPPRRRGGDAAAGEWVVGTLARDAGLRQPGRRIASAKSWLSHDGVDRSAPLLPWQGDADVTRHSPVDISARYLQHIRQAWDAAHPEAPLAEQDVVITLPASFDEVARELTVVAARRAGLPRVYLIEEPQAAFYAWIGHHRDDWQDRIQPGQMILVCDIGGGTSDFTLIRVRPAGDGGGEVQFHRVAVGQHLILGGDNLDLALAKFAEAKLTGEGQALPPRDWDRLIQACRVAKETLLSDSRPESLTLSIAGDSSRLIGGGRSVTLSGTECDRVLVDGFFPEVSADAEPQSGQSGFREFGLPYAHDAAVTRHLAAFLATHARSGLEADDTAGAERPDWVLFNGGVMSSSRLRQRLLAAIGGWFADGTNWRPGELDAQSLDLAVAHGAAYYGMVRRGLGIKIAANLGRSYFLQVGDSPPTAICLVPGSAESGQRFSPSQSLRLQLGSPVQFPLWVTSTRLADGVGDLVTIDRAELSPLPPIRTVLTRGKRKQVQTIDVRMEAELSEIGTLGLYCVSEEGQRWKLEFDIRSTLQTDRAAHGGAGEALGIVDQEIQAECDTAIRQAFAATGPAGDGPARLVKRLKSVSGLDRSGWPPSLLRGMWQTLMDVSDGRRASAAHETRWLNLVGYCLRPGYGMAVDDWRVTEVWRHVYGKLAFAAAGSRTESLILWRRIAGGMTAGQQEQLILPQISLLTGRSANVPAHEAAELWRLAGSLELLSSTLKMRLLEAAVQQLSSKKSAGYRAALLWAIGRMASRDPIYGPLNTVVPAERVETIVKSLMSDDSEPLMRQLAVMQIAQQTNDRYRDLSPATRERVIAWFESTDAAARYVDTVRSGGGPSGEDAAALFGESLPLGIQLIRH